MRRFLLTFFLAAPVLLAQTRSPKEIASGHVASKSGLIVDDMSSLYLAKEYKTAHNGVTHLVYRQRFQGIDVENAAWVVNIGPDDTIVSSGGKLYPAPDTVNFADQLPAATAA